MFLSLFLLYVHRYHILESEKIGNEDLWAAGISSLLCTHTNTYNVTERPFSSQQTLSFVYVQSGMFLKGLMFSGGVFSVKCALKDELTVTFAEYPWMKKYEFLLFGVGEKTSTNSQLQKRGDVAPLATLSLFIPEELQDDLRSSMNSTHCEWHYAKIP